MPNRTRRRAGSARLDGRRRAAAVLRRIGVALKDCRLALHLTQAEAAHRAGVSQPFWSRLERGLVISISIETLASCAAAVGVQLAAFIEARPGADLPRDIEHLRRQELVISLARLGGWHARPEFGIDPGAAWSRSVDVLLVRGAQAEIAVVEIVDLLADAGSALRGLADKVAAVRRARSPSTRVAGLLVLCDCVFREGLFRRLQPGGTSIYGQATRSCGRSGVAHADKASATPFRAPRILQTAALSLLDMMERLGAPAGARGRPRAARMAQ
jgi:transcriptional regulator with XRE-family HTH domain